MLHDITSLYQLTKQPYILVDCFFRGGHQASSKTNFVRIRAYFFFFASSGVAVKEAPKRTRRTEKPTRNAQKFKRASGDIGQFGYKIGYNNGFTAASFSFVTMGYAGSGLIVAI
jgi:hypothetical protein